MPIAGHAELPGIPSGGTLSEAGNALTDHRQTPGDSGRDHPHINEYRAWFVSFLVGASVPHCLRFGASSCRA
jgi:hypothetical protein